MSGRIRSLKPEILEDAVTAGLSDTAFRMFIALIVLSDDYGRFRAEPGWLRGQVYWSREVAPVAFTKALDELVVLVSFYSVNGQRYGAVRNWSKHQKVDKPGKPRIPPPPEDGGKPRESVSEVSRDSRESLATDLGSGISDLGSGISDQGPRTTREDHEREALRSPAPEPKTMVRLRAPKAPSAGTALPRDWQVSASLAAWAKGAGIVARDVQAIADRFTDHWWQQEPARNKNAIKRDWDAAFRTWARRDIEAGKVVAMPRPAVAPEPPPTQEQITVRGQASEAVTNALAILDARRAREAS